MPTFRPCHCEPDAFTAPDMKAFKQFHTRRVRCEVTSRQLRCQAGSDFHRKSCCHCDPIHVRSVAHAFRRLERACSAVRQRQPHCSPWQRVGIFGVRTAMLARVERVRPSSATCVRAPGLGLSMSRMMCMCSSVFKDFVAGPVLFPFGGAVPESLSPGNSGSRRRG